MTAAPNDSRSALRPDTPYWQHPRYERFYRQLEKAWECGMDEVSQYVEEESSKFEKTPVPYDYVLAGLKGMLEYALFPGMEFTADEIDHRWGDLARTLTTNADPIVILWELKRNYPRDFTRRKER